jgi:hypothetical protein
VGDSLQSPQVWLDPTMVWAAKLTGKRGRQPVYSDAAIHSRLTMKVLFRMVLRKTAGFVESLLHLIDLDRAGLQHAEPPPEDPEGDIFCSGSDGPLHLLSDSTAIKVKGEGRWNARNHGGSKRRVWRKTYIRCPLGE